MDDQNKSMNERWAPGVPSGERGYATDPGFASGEYAVDRRHVDEPVRDDAPDARTEQIRSEIDRTREDMTETIDAIQDRLSPRNAVARAAENVREATVGRVREAAHTLRDQMPGSRRDWSGGDGFADRIRENPVPAVIAAASLAWLAFGGRRAPRHDMGRAIYGSTRGGDAFIRETRIDVSGDAADTSASGASAGARVQETMHRAGDRVQDTMYRATDRVQHAASDAQYRARRLKEQNPLAAGAIAAAVGLAVGLALPETERENELMGESRDALVDRGRQTVRQAAEGVQEAAQEVQRVASRALGSTADPNPTDVRGADNP